MELEQRSIAGRLARPILFTLLLAASLAIPAYLWLTRGRALPLGVVIDPPRYVVAAGGRVELRPRVTPASARSQVQLTWKGQGVEPAEQRWRAPTRPGSYTVELRGRRSGTVLKDAVTFQVPRGAGELKLARPAAEPPPPAPLPPCPRAAPPRVTVHGRPCCGATLVLHVEDAGDAPVWHRLERAGIHRRGAWAELVLPGPDVLVTRVLLSDKGCERTARTPLSPGDCRAGPRPDAVFADFSWELVSPGHFRFAAKPSRTPNLVFSRYSWDLGQGKNKVADRPRMAHRFEGPPRRHRLVWLEVQARWKGALHTARSPRLVIDRTVE